MPRINLKDSGKRPARIAHERAAKETRYNTHRWQKIRALQLKKSPLCAHCGGLGRDCDHITPVRLGGDFWRGPFQTLCASCHNAKSAREKHEGPSNYVKGEGGPNTGQ